MGAEKSGGKGSDTACGSSFLKTVSRHSSVTIIVPNRTTLTYTLLYRIACDNKRLVCGSPCCGKVGKRVPRAEERTRSLIFAALAMPAPTSPCGCIIRITLFIVLLTALAQAGAVHPREAEGCRQQQGCCQ
mmetsp:Transcript_19557/g.16112  ORF Transcript_19557/g.16112 Transcript_19557/m.16112 type:complete len:131 (-) Transcript_19557:222-614(-)